MQLRSLFTVFLLLLCSGAYAQKFKISRLEKWHTQGNYHKVLEKGTAWTKKYPDEGMLYYWMARSHGALVERTIGASKQRNLKATMQDWQRALAYAGPAVNDIDIQFAMWLQYSVKEQAVKAYQDERAQAARFFTGYLASQFGDTLAFAWPLMGWEAKPIVLARRIRPEILPPWAHNPQNPITFPEYEVPRDSVLAAAARLQGTPYLWAGEQPQTGFDCSGFVLYVLRSQGYETLHGTRYFKELGFPKEETDAEPGDLVFFGTRDSEGNPRVSHMGFLYQTGEGQRQIIHCPSRGVVIDDLNEGNYWTKKILFFRDLVDVGTEEDVVPQ